MVLHLASGVTNKLERPTIQQALNQNAEQKEFADQLINVTDSASDATKFTNSLNLFNSSIEDVREAADRLITRNISPNIVMWESLRDMNQPADQRMLELQAMIQRPVVSAGNDDQAKQTSRIWVAPFAARGTQKLDSVNNGYKSNIQGGTLGADYSMNASFLIGAAYSRLNTNIKYQGTKIGDKTKAHTNIMSLYSVYTWPNNCFLEGVLSYGWSQVKTNEGRRASTSMENATGQYTARAYSGQLVIGYNHFDCNKVIITPIIGLRYAKFREASYQERGASYQNLSVKGESYDKLEGLVGLRVSTLILTEQMLIIPELHSNINYNIRGKSPKIEARIDGIDALLPTKQFKQPKIFYNIGAGLIVKCNNNQAIEYGIQYNATFATKYIGHQGSIKIKTNF